MNIFSKFFSKFKKEEPKSTEILVTQNEGITQMSFAEAINYLRNYEHSFFFMFLDPDYKRHEFSISLDKTDFYPIFHNYMMNNEVCKSVSIVKQYNNGYTFYNVKVKSVELNNLIFKLEITFSFDRREPYHKVTEYSELKEIFSDGHILTVDEYRTYREDLLNAGYSFITSSNGKLCLKEPK